MTSPPRSNSALSIMRGLRRWRLARTSSRSGKASSTVTLVMKPMPPRFTARIGTSDSLNWRAAASSVPSPPRTMSRSIFADMISGLVSFFGGLKQEAATASNSTLTPRCSSHCEMRGTTAQISSLRGLQNIPAFLMLDMRFGGLYRIEARMEEKFLIAFSAGHTTALNAQDCQSGFFGRRAYARNGALTQRRFTDDAAFAHKIFRQFKLWLDENEKLGVRLRQRHDGGKNFGYGDERDIHGDDADRLDQVFGPEKARIFFYGTDARVALQLPIQLIRIDVDGVNTLRSMLQKTIREAAV